MIKGNLVSVYTPKRNITACEVTSGGKHVVLAHDGFQDLITMELRGPGIEHSEPTEVYGLPENNAKVFELKESDVC